MYDPEQITYAQLLDALFESEYVHVMEREWHATISGSLLDQITSSPPVYEAQQSHLCIVSPLPAEIDPLQREGQGADVGSQYRTGIYTHSQVQAQVGHMLCRQ